ncbi:hypothetical protein OG458_40795 [Streptomyces sp. NBC_01281]|uniref:hypothetical protein n=1 Tax=unclassified Streptomyces TaxID=2593676 RepID=UPI002E0F94B9|nr:hypothetical protein OG458_40795 [Streptomyces sp. NBC_01281]
MTQQTTADDQPVDLSLPLDQPEPVPRCDVCAALARQRAEAEAAGDWSKVTDCNVEIRDHPPHRRQQVPEGLR